MQKLLSDDLMEYLDDQNWTDRSGKVHKFKDMDDLYLHNVAKFIINRQVGVVNRAQPFYGRLQGEMAIYYAEQDLKAMWDKVEKAVDIAGLIEAYVYTRNYNLFGDTSPNGTA